MVCSPGAVTGVVVSAATVFGDVPPHEVADLLRDAVRDLLVRADAPISPS
jgi:hypothetical protein